ncbi:MAG: hypothetical protein V3R99_07065, partial [Thermoguttaceae bacterium]
PPDDLTVLEEPESDLGYSQLNELLLLFGFDRITSAFFRFLLDGETDYERGLAFSSADQLRAGIDRFRELAILLYGNVKFAFKSLSTDDALLSGALHSLLPISQEEFTSRHDPVLSLRDISPDDAYLTGYLIERELRERLKANPDDKSAVHLEECRQNVVAQATANQDAYLASDHLDVYVATSMRERHEFSAINRLTSAIFQDPSLADLKLRWFDPTQAYCPDRIDKGLSEALMLRRASCTIYLAQESDTLGKDSELASTLAQGKPVVAFVPEVTDAYVQAHWDGLQESHPKKSEPEILLGQLAIYDPAAAWSDPIVRGWCDAPLKVDESALRQRLSNRMKRHYDKRAETLRESHPLGIQVNLKTGVANGVLVVRTVRDCARLIRNIVMHQLEFQLEENDQYVALREKISGCVFRVMTRDSMLTNTFWNFYLDPAE